MNATHVNRPCLVRRRGDLAPPVRCAGYSFNNDYAVVEFANPWRLEFWLTVEEVTQ